MSKTKQRHRVLQSALDEVTRGAFADRLPPKEPTLDELCDNLREASMYLVGLAVTRAGSTEKYNAAEAAERRARNALYEALRERGLSHRNASRIAEGF